MQEKGLIKFFTIILTLACLYSLSFTFVTRQVEKKAAAFANGDPVKEKAYLDSVADQTVYDLGFTQFSYLDCKAREIPLGLDLKGGMSVTLEISLEELIQNLAGNTKDQAFNDALVNAERLSKQSQKDFVTLFGEEFKKLKPNTPLASFFATKDNAASVNQKSSDTEVLNFLRKESESAVDRSYIIIRSRIDKFGVSSPNIQKEEGTNRILVELPGVTDEDRVRKLLQGSAKLEFWETYDNLNIFPLLENINKTLVAVVKDTSKLVASSADTSKNSEAGRLAALTEGKTDTTKSDTVSNNPSNALNPLFAVLAPSTGQAANGQQVLRSGPVVGYVAQKDTALVNSYLNEPTIKSIIPSNIKFAWSVKPISTEEKVFELYALKPSNFDGSAALTGSVIADASADYDQYSNPEVVMVMNTEGARQWKKITAEASSDPNNKKAIAIVLDNVVYSAPTVQNEIPNGRSSITGNFKVEDTQDLANVLKAGRLPAPAKIVEEAVVGPTLGQAAITAGVTSSIIGFVIVLIFMIAYYHRAGVVANMAVVVNVFFIMGILASIGAVLTLPGIAGIVLTMGTAVDANVLIYERMREEMEGGKSWRQIIADGYKHAMPSILDSQITTFLIGVILYFFGSGPIVGFATTLMIGIITSLFTSIFITRIIFDWMLNKDWKISVSYPWSANTLRNANYAFIKNRKKFYTFSIAITIISIIFILVKGFSLGVDFAGGRTYVAQFEKEVNLESIRNDVNESFGEEAIVKTFGTNNNQVSITTAYLVDQTDEASDNMVLDKLKEGLNKSNIDFKIVSSQKVGPTIANDIKVSAIYSVIFAVIGIGLYVLLRFKKWQYSVGAAIALVHDAIILIGIFSILDGIVPFSLNIDQSFIAAILTVIGYSINDTVVVFDRIREFLGMPIAKKQDHAIIINDAINRTLSRTIITSLTVIFVLGVLFVFGGEVIRGFSFAILFGIVFGTYSSIFLAAPIVYDLEKLSLKNTVAEPVNVNKPVKV